MMVAFDEHLKDCHIQYWRSLDKASQAAPPVDDTNTEPHRATDNKAILNVLGLLRRQVLARARTKGVKVGRPKLRVELRQQIAKRAAMGQTPYAIAKALRIDRHTAAKYAVCEAGYADDMGLSD